MFQGVYFEHSHLFLCPKEWKLFFIHIWKEEIGSVLPIYLSSLFDIKDNGTLLPPKVLRQEADFFSPLNLL